MEPDDGSSGRHSSVWDFFKIPSFLRPAPRAENLHIPDIRINSGDGPLPEVDNSSRENDNESTSSLPIHDEDTSSVDTNLSGNTGGRSQSDDQLEQGEASGTENDNADRGGDEKTTTPTSTLKRRNLCHIISPEDAKLLKLTELNDDVAVRNILRSRVTRPRLASHPNFSSPSYLLPDLQTAPILPSMSGSGINTRRKSIFFNLRRASHVQGLVASESMVSLTNRALVSFIAEENFTGFQHFLENRRIVIDDRDDHGATALMVASARNKLSFVRLLIEHGADVNAEDNDKWCPLLFAAKEGHHEIIAELLDHGALVNCRDLGAWTPLMWSCYKNKPKAARLLMERGADVNAYGDYNVTCLGWAAGRGCTEIVHDLIQHSARVNIGDKYGTTPLIWASRKGNLEIVDMLLAAEAHIDASGMTSWTALLVAAAGNHVEVVKLLLEHKPNVNALDKDGCSALTLACKDGFHETAVALINYGAYINTSDRGGSSNLIHAAKGGHYSIVEALIKKHADINMHGKDRKTALYWAVEKSHVRVVRLLLGANPDLEIATKEGDTSLLKAVRNRNVEIVALLLEKRAKVSAADKNGDTCLHIAMRARSKQIVELLLRNPVHSQLLYRPNRSAETPYNIDRSSPKAILPQIFGHRGLNTQEDGENLLGYSLYSSALADMLSDPTLNMPIVIGLFARWGSGKSFLLSKLREEMKSFAKQWFNPVFSFNMLTSIVILGLASTAGVIAGLSVTDYRWVVGLSFTIGILVCVHVSLFIIWYASRRAKYEWSMANRVSRYLATKVDSLKLICQVIFCHPPGYQFSDQTQQAQPINFYFTEQTKISSTTGGENSVVQMLGSLYTCLENDYGSIPTRLYRAFRPRPVSSTSDWRWRRLCCIPYFIVFLLCFTCTLIGVSVLVLSLLSDTKANFNIIPLKVTMYACALFVGILLVANFYTLGQVAKAIIFSHRRHLQRTVSKMYAVKAEGFLHSLKNEVNLLTDMVKCLNAFTNKQSRMVVIVDGLDSGEQEKVLQVLDAVHILFSDARAPFIILLAIDPHITAKGIEMNINPVLNESNISPYDYLRNLIHLPFYLQNAALRKVKHVKMLESTLKKKAYDDDPGPQIVLTTRRASVESAFGIAMPLTERFEKPSKGKSKRLNLKTTESIASSLASNLNKVNGPTDLKKMLLGDDYFSDVNPRSMRRLMNIIHITGRLLKAFNIDFNWYHLSTFVNITEQWPYRLSWMILYCEQFQKDLDDSLSLKAVCERVKPFVPTSKDVDPNAALDRDDKKLDVYLGLHKNSLLVSTMYIFLPFTINLDPQLRKDITELYQPLDQFFKTGTTALANQGVVAPPSPYLQPHFNQNLRFRNTGRPAPVLNGPVNYYGGFPQANIPIQSQVPPMWPYPTPASYGGYENLSHDLLEDKALVKQLKNKRLGQMSVESVCDLIGSLPVFKSSNIAQYQDMFRKNNICGRVLLHCDLNELKQVLQMSFGDWEIFKSVIVVLRELDRDSEARGSESGTGVSQASGDVRINVTSDKADSGNFLSVDTDKKQLRPNVLEKQVTMEEQLICGALELLNDDARDDARKGEDSSSTLSPTNSEGGQAEPLPRVRSARANSKSHVEQNETDVLYVTGHSMNLTAELPDSPSILRKLESQKFSISNEVQSRSSTNVKGDGAPAKETRMSQTSLYRNTTDSPGKRVKGMPRNTSNTSLLRDASLKEKGILKSPGGFESRKNSRKASKTTVQKESSSDTSSDESQKALISKLSATTAAHARKTSTKSARGNENQTSHPPSPKKRMGRDESASRFSKIKSSIFGASSKDERSEYQTSGSSSSHFFRPSRIETDESEPAVYFREPAHSSRHQGQPWVQYRAPTPMPVFGSEEYYKVIKSNNPSPTTSNESELGSTPEHLSSGEVLFLPGPPDLPESPYPRRQATASHSLPYAGVETIVPIPQLASYPQSHGFVPFQSISGLEQSNKPTNINSVVTETQSNEADYRLPQSSSLSQVAITGRPPIPRKVHGKTVSTGEDVANHRSKSLVQEIKRDSPINEEKLRDLRTKLVESGLLVKSPLMQSDPVLFKVRTSDSDSTNANTQQQKQDEVTLALIHEEMNARREAQRRENAENIDRTPDDNTTSSPKSPLQRQASLDLLDPSNSGDNISK